MAEEQEKENTSEEFGPDAAAAAEKQKALAERLVVGKGDTRNMTLPFCGALIKIDQNYYEPSQLRISAFAINPYDGQLIAGQMFQCSILLPGEKEPYEVSIAGAVKTVDESFGLRAVFSSPQPQAQQALAQHLILSRKAEAANAKPDPKAASKKKGLW
ncbi:MAG: hypothetical protein WCJ64_07095 [Rhodospirillaceae bacterium]